MSRLAFLAPAAGAVSPIAAVADGVVVTDATGIRVLELRGPRNDLAVPAGATLLALTPERALLIGGEGEAPAGVRSYDVTAAWAAFEVEGEALLRRLTELDLAHLPAAGAILRGTSAVIERRGGERFRILVAQELGEYVVETVLDLAEGLR